MRALSFSTLLLLVLAAALPAAGDDGDRKIRILGVGNSFTINSTKYLPRIVASDPAVKADIGVASIGGCPLDRHVELAKLHEAEPDNPKGKIYRYTLNDTVVKQGASLKEILQDGRWDYVTIQQLSSKSYKPETYTPYARELHDYIRRYAPGARVVIHETWSHRVDCPRTKLWNLTPEAMYEKLHAAYAKIAKELDAPVIPVGTAFENAKKTPLWDYVPPADFDPKDLKPGARLPDQSKSLHAGYYWRKDRKTGKRTGVAMDGYHAGMAGEYLGGLVWYEFFFGRDARKVAFAPSTLNAEQAASLKEAAHLTMERARPVRRDR